MLTLEHLEAIRARVGLSINFRSYKPDFDKALRDREALLGEVDRLTRALEDARPLLAARQHLAARVQSLEEALCDWAAQTMHPKE